MVRAGAAATAHPAQLARHHRQHRCSRRADQIDAAMQAPGAAGTGITPAKGGDFPGPAAQRITQPGPRHTAPALGHRCCWATAWLRQTRGGGRGQVGHHRAGSRGGSYRVTLLGCVGSSRWQRQPGQGQATANPDQAEQAAAAVQQRQGPGGAKVHNCLPRLCCLPCRSLWCHSLPCHCLRCHCLARCQPPSMGALYRRCSRAQGDPPA